MILILDILMIKPDQIRASYLLLRCRRYKGGQIPQIYLRFKELEEEEEEDDDDWMTKKKKEAIEIVEEMDEAERMRQEEMLRLRSQVGYKYCAIDS